MQLTLALTLFLPAESCGILSKLLVVTLVQVFVNVCVLFIRPEGRVKQSLALLFVLLVYDLQNLVKLKK
ncbi:hypothetical protein ST47_g9671 [Ascochyta rabiei]|uniref:Uncharacterized protein n=1 Tax=Didymella rabiei TaxID=5454 RepID=A0A162WS09_DIDRA|nr:hypothetical protein ST47_g9671 [Ascochyta rabiei]